jgi:hypothetical protein
LYDCAGLGYLIAISQDVVRSFLAPNRWNDWIERLIGRWWFVFQGWFECYLLSALVCRGFEPQIRSDLWIFFFDSCVACLFNCGPVQSFE